jgi:single-strand DNA-binding protein
MATFETVGVLKLKKDTQVVSDKFSKREFVMTLDPNDKYPQHVPFQVSQDKCGLLDGFNVGDELKLSVNIRGNEWNDRYFVNLEAWKIELVSKASLSTQVQNAVDALPKDEIADSLPF